MNEQIRRLEEKVAYLERHVVEQDKAMLELVEELARVRKDLLGLRARLETPSAMGEEERGDLSSERPPHY